MATATAAANRNAPSRSSRRAKAGIRGGPRGEQNRGDGGQREAAGGVTAGIAQRAAYRPPEEGLEGQFGEGHRQRDGDRSQTRAAPGAARHHRRENQDDGQRGDQRRFTEIDQDVEWGGMRADGRPQPAANGRVEPVRSGLPREQGAEDGDDRGAGQHECGGQPAPVGRDQRAWIGTATAWSRPSAPAMGRRPR